MYFKYFTVIVYGFLVKRTLINNLDIPSAVRIRAAYNWQAMHFEYTKYILVNVRVTNDHRLVFL